MGRAMRSLLVLLSLVWMHRSNVTVAANFLGNRYDMELPEEVINRDDVNFLASDELNGRNNASPGSITAQEYLIDQLIEMGAAGLNAGQTGRSAYKQEFFGLGTNILAVVKGSELPDEYVMLSAHYDHLAFCFSTATASSDICNGATDNAAGAAVVLGIGRTIATLPTAPRRSVVIALWDAEEDDLVGSRFYTENPLFPLEQIITVLNYDIQGSNLTPSVRDSSFAIGAETGGWRLKRALERAKEDTGLDMLRLSLLLGQGRSDHASFADSQVPVVFFSDATNGCYHTSGDELTVVDFGKLEKQAKIGLKLAFDLASTKQPPSRFKSSLIPATFSDAKVLNDIANLVAANDLYLFDTVDQDTLLFYQSELNSIVAGGRIKFLMDLVTAGTEGRFANAVLGITDILTAPECDGFLLEE